MVSYCLWVVYSIMRPRVWLVSTSNEWPFIMAKWPFTHPPPPPPGGVTSAWIALMQKSSLNEDSRGDQKAPLKGDIGHLSHPKCGLLSCLYTIMISYRDGCRIEGAQKKKLWRTSRPRNAAKTRTTLPRCIKLFARLFIFAIEKLWQIFMQIAMEKYNLPEFPEFLP